MQQEAKNCPVHLYLCDFKRKVQNAALCLFLFSVIIAKNITEIRLLIIFKCLPVT